MLGVIAIFKGQKVTAILLAAGSGSRMKLNINKVYHTHKTQNIPLLYYPLAALEKNDYVDEIILVIRRDDSEEVKKVVNRGRFPKKPVKIVIGGEKRYDSVYNGILKAAGDIVLIHDGARPLLKQRFITDCIEAMDTYPGSVVGIENVDQIYYLADENGCAISKLQGTVYRIQTPQCFHTRVIKECHKKVLDKRNVADDSILLELCGHKFKIVPGDESNIKITHAKDVVAAESFILSDEEIFNLYA